MLNILELCGTINHKSDRCIFFKTEKEAETVQRWLRDNHVRNVKRISQKEFDAISEDICYD